LELEGENGDTEGEWSLDDVEDVWKGEGRSRNEMLREGSMILDCTFEEWNGIMGYLL